MAQIIYLHGFASVGEGPKTESLRKRFPDTKVFAPNIPANAPQAYNTIKEVIREAINCSDDPIILVGTSMGGFYANHFAQLFDLPCVLINPATKPSKTMADRVGKEYFNYKTGDRIVMTAQDMATFASMEEETEAMYNGFLVDLFVAQDDDVILVEDTLNSVLKYTRTRTRTIDGGHRFLGHWGLVEDLLETRITE